MIFYFNFSFLLKILCDYRFVVLDSDYSAVKSLKQIKKHCVKVQNHFQNKFDITLDEGKSADHFMLLNKDELVAYIKTNKQNYQRKTYFGTKKYVGLGIYNVCVDNKYKNNGYSKILMDKMVNYYKKKFSNHKTTLLTLHISCVDLYMVVAAKLYYNAGFRNFCWAVQGFEDFAFDLNYFDEHSVDFYKLAMDPNQCSKNGHYLASYCSLHNYRKGNLKAPSDFLAKGKIIKNEMKRRKTEKKSYSFEDSIF
ncbi:hypothetical protein NUSPORA_01644 [Nucleospora cyclopteri]